jgi:pyruvate dehydrogenase E1 component subunit alpha
MAAERKPVEAGPFRILDRDGKADPDRDPKLPGEDLRRLYRAMVLLRHVDERMLRLQRQGRLGFYMTSTGEEACQLGSAYALSPDDWIFPSYREPGVAFWRGYTLKDFMCELMGNAADPGLGRQMPVHHSVKSIHFVSISSPVGTQIPQATGAAMAARIRGDKNAVITYFGDGATSTSDFHVGMNFAGVYRAPVVFFCRNNRWAISVPYSRQTAAPTIAQKARAYGFSGVRVDGNDLLAVLVATREALERARAGDGPTLIEAETYRLGSHSSSDDPNAYRDAREPKEWQERDPIERFRRHMERGKVWDAVWQKQIEEEVQAEVTAALKSAEAEPPKPPLETLFDDVYAELPWHLREQKAALINYLSRHPAGGH